MRRMMHICEVFAAPHSGLAVPAWNRCWLFTVIWLGIVVTLGVCNSANGAIAIRTLEVRATANAIADGIDDPRDQETDIQSIFGSGNDALALVGSANTLSTHEVAISGSMIASAGSSTTIHRFDPAASQFTIVARGSAFGTTARSDSLGLVGGVGEASTRIEFRITDFYYVAFSATTVPGNSSSARATFSFFDSFNPSVNGYLTSGQSTIIGPGRPFTADSYSMLYAVDGITSSGTGTVSSFTMFLSFSTLDAGPIGSSQLAPLPPTVMGEGVYEFKDAASGAWVDPPLTDGYRYTMTDGSLFTGILDFPTGYADSFRVYVGGQLLGSFGPGQSVDFLSLLGGGVSEFLLRGINPLVDVGNPAGFPLRLAFNTSTADFVMTADPTPPTPVDNGVVPEPASMATWSLLAVLLSARRWRAGRRGWPRWVAE